MITSYDTKLLNLRLPNTSHMTISDFTRHGEIVTTVSLMFASIISQKLISIADLQTIRLSLPAALRIPQQARMRHEESWTETKLNHP